MLSYLADNEENRFFCLGYLYINVVEEAIDVTLNERLIQEDS